ncbi:MAG: hypothetical protein ABTQ26_00250 [Azonexus sp.]
MNIKIFNACLLIGWLLVLAGGLLINPGPGLIGAGLLLVILVLIVSRLAGIYADPETTETPE